MYREPLPGRDGGPDPIDPPGSRVGELWLEVWDISCGAWIPYERHATIDAVDAAMVRVKVPTRQLRTVRVTGVGPEPRRGPVGEHRGSRA